MWCGLPSLHPSPRAGDVLIPPSGLGASRSLTPTTPSDLNTQGLSLARQSRLPQALEAFKRAVSLQHDFAEAHYNLAKALKDSGKLDDAADAYRRAVRLAPNSGAAWQNLGNVLQELGRPDEAIDAYRRVLSFEPDNAANGKSDFGSTPSDLSATDSENQPDEPNGNYGSPSEISESDSPF